MKSDAQSRRTNLRTLGLFVLPMVVLTAVIAMFLRFDPTPQRSSVPPVESLVIERYELERGTIMLHVRNSSTKPITVAQVIINDAVWPFEALPSPTIGRLATSILRMHYLWSGGEAYSVRVITSNSMAFTIDIPVAVESPRAAPQTFIGFTLIGIYVGVIPVFLGILWFPALKQLGKRAMTFLLAATVGLLLFLGIDTLFEAREASLALPDAFQGPGLIALGVVGTILLLEGISARKRASTGTATLQRFVVARTIAIGIGFHNLGEGLAIGAAYNIGEIALGQFLVVGFILQNITEGLGVVAPILRDSPGVRRLVGLGIIAGAPAILGAWIGGFFPAPVLSVVFLAIGAGAILQVIYEVWRLLNQDASAHDSRGITYGGVMAGMLALWISGLLIK